MDISQEETDRYSRQIPFEGWGEAGQLKLKGSTVFVAGCGGLGSPVLSYLTAAGVGTIRMCDDGDLELSNLNRQVLYRTGEIGEGKAQLAAGHLAELNPEVTLLPLSQRMTVENAEQVIGEVDLLIDCLDNFSSREVLNRYSVGHGIPMIHAGVAGMSGQIIVLDPPRTACLACLIPPGTPEYTTPPPVVGAAPGVLGAIQASEALKLLAGVGQVSYGAMTVWDGDSGVFDRVIVEKNPGCSVCGSG